MAKKKTQTKKARLTKKGLSDHTKLSRFVMPSTVIFF
jgi:hypothetical protein